MTPPADGPKFIAPGTGPGIRWRRRTLSESRGLYLRGRPRRTRHLTYLDKSSAMILPSSEKDDAQPSGPETPQDGQELRRLFGSASSRSDTTRARRNLLAGARIRVLVKTGRKVPHLRGLKSVPPAGVGAG